MSRYKASLMSRALILVTLLIALVGAGCGEDDSPVSTALGGKDPSDAETVRRFVGTAGGLPETDIEIVRAFAKNDFDEAEEKIDAMREMGADSLAVAEKAHGAQLRDTLTEYAKAITGVADAYQEVIEVGETATGPQIEQLTKRIVDAKQHLQKYDRRFVEAYRKVSSPEEYRKQLERQRQLDEQLRDAANGE
jgi:hypothetical protein